MLTRLAVKSTSAHVSASSSSGRTNRYIATAYACRHSIGTSSHASRAVASTG